MSDLRNLTFSVNITGNENPVVRTDKAMDELAKTTGRTTKELASTSKGIQSLGSKKNIYGIDKSKRTIEDYTKSLDATQMKLKNISGGMKKVGGNLTKFVSLPLVGVGLASAKLAQDLNKDLATISTLIPGQTERLYELKKGIQDVSIEVAKDTTEIAEGTYAVISAYGDAADTMDKVRLNAKAATAGVSTTNDALNLSSAVMKGFGDTSAKANEKVLDLAFGTVKLGQTTFSELASSLGKVVPLVSELGISQEELFGIYATATGVVGNASEVTTQYKSVLQSLMSPTKDMTALISKMGYANGKAMVSGEGMIGTISAIDEASKASGKPLQAYISSAEGVVLALALAGNLSKDYKVKTEQLVNSQGMMTEAFKEQTEGINASGFKFAQSMQKMKVAGQNMGESVSPMISALADSFSKISEKLVSVSPETLQFVAKLGLVLLAIGPIIKVGSILTGVMGGTIGAISTIIGAIGVVTTGAIAATPAVAALAAVFGFLSMPVLIAIGAITLLVAAGVLLYKNWGTVSAWGKKVGGEISRGWQKTKDDTVAMWNAMTDGITSAIGRIKEGWEGLKAFFKNPIKGAINIIKDTKENANATGNIDGSHAGGLARVPFNNYVANLHEDEEVLRVDDPRNQNNKSVTTTNNTRGGILFSPVYNITLEGTATDNYKQDIEKVIDRKTREMFNIFFKEMNMKLA